MHTKLLTIQSLRKIMHMLKNNSKNSHEATTGLLQQMQHLVRIYGTEQT